MLRGLTTTTFYADDLDEAARWYTEVFGLAPYFVVPGGYIEFRIGDYQHEFGLVDSRHAPHDTSTQAGAIAYWHVDDIDAAFARLLSLGAQVHDTPRVRGEGFVTASVIDPFGNILGIMFNQHFLDVLASTTA